MAAFHSWTQLSCASSAVAELNVMRVSANMIPYLVAIDLSLQFLPALHGVLRVKSVTLGGQFDRLLSLQEVHRRQVAQC